MQRTWRSSDTKARGGRGSRRTPRCRCRRTRRVEHHDDVLGRRQPDSETSTPFWSLSVKSGALADGEGRRVDLVMPSILPAGRRQRRALRLGGDELVRAPVLGGVEGARGVQPRGDGRLVDVAGVDLVAGGLGGEQHDEAPVVEDPDHVDERVAEVAVAVAPPEEHGIGPAGVVLVLDLGAAEVLDGEAELVVDVGVVAELLDHLVAGEPEPLDGRGAVRTWVDRRWGGGVHGVSGLSGSGAPCGCRVQSTNPAGSGARGRSVVPTRARHGPARRPPRGRPRRPRLQMREHRGNRAGGRHHVHGRHAEAGSSQPWRRVSDWIRAWGTATARA